MKKPSLRFRQVFEHPTHFKVTRPLGNPIKIAKQGLSPQLMGRLRKFAEGGLVTDAAEEARQSLSNISGGMAAPGTAVPEYIPTSSLDEAYAGSVKTIPSKTADLTDTGQRVAAPSLQEIKSSPAFVSEMSDLNTIPALQDAYAAESAKPRPDEALLADIKARFTQLVGTPAASAAPVMTTEASARQTPVTATPSDLLEIPGSEAKVPGAAQAQPVAAAAPVAPTPTIEDVAKQRVDEYAKQRELAMDTQEQAQRDLYKAEQDLQQERERKAYEEYQRRMGALAGAERAEREATAEKPMGARDVLSAIGSALSVAAGAFATGMTGMPNFALQIYNAGVDEALKRARENRQSAYNKAIQAGVDAADAEKYWRAQQDKTMALALQEKAQTVGNAEARVKFLDAAQQFYGKARKEEAEVQKTIAEASKLAAEAKSVPLKDQTAALEVQRKATADYMDARNEANKIKVTDADSLRDYNAAIFKAKTQLEADLASITAKKPEGVAEMGAPIPDFLKGADDKELRKHRIEFEMPERDKDGNIITKRQIGFLVDPDTRKEFMALSTGFATAKRQAEEIRDWAKANPTGLAGIALTKGIGAANQEREKLEPLVKTMVEGYIKNVTGIRRASSAAIKYMQEVVKNPAEMKNFMTNYLGGSTSRFNEIIKEIESGEYDLRNQYIAGGVPQPPEAQFRRGVPFAP